MNAADALQSVNLLSITLSYDELLHCCITRQWDDQFGLAFDKTD